MENNTHGWILNTDADEWYETRPYVTLPQEHKVNNLTAGVLRGPGKIAVPPLVWAKKDETEAWVFIHLGRGVCVSDSPIHVLQYLSFIGSTHEYLWHKAVDNLRGFQYTTFMLLDSLPTESLGVVDL